MTDSISDLLHLVDDFKEHNQGYTDALQESREFRSATDWNRMLDQEVQKNQDCVQRIKSLENKLENTMINIDQLNRKLLESTEEFQGQIKSLKEEHAKTSKEEKKSFENKLNDVLSQLKGTEQELQK